MAIFCAKAAIARRSRIQLKKKILEHAPANDPKAENPVIPPVEKSAAEAPEKEKELSPEEKKREERFSEAQDELQALRVSLPQSPLSTNALDLLHEVWDRPVADAVREVNEARAKNEILKYHAAIILHALVPDKVAKPEILDIGPREPKEDIPEMSVEQMADEELPAESVVATSGKPVPGYPEGYVPGPKKERPAPGEREVLDQKLTDGIIAHRNVYRNIRGDGDAWNAILNSGPNGVANFLDKLQVLTGILRLGLASDVMKRYDLIITSARETGVANGSIDINDADLASGDMDAVENWLKK